MNKKLLLTTALVSIAFIGNVYATDKYFEYKNGDVISDNNIGHTSSGTRISFVGNDSTVTIEKDITLGNFTTLDGKTKLISGGEGTKKVTIKGYLTQTASGSDISGVDLEIQKGTVGAKEEGELVLGNDLKVGNVAMTDGTGIWLNTTNTEHKLDIVKDKNITFNNNNYITGNKDATLTFEGEGSVKFEGQTKLGQDITLISDNKINIDGSKNGVFSGLNGEVSNNGQSGGKLILNNGIDLTHGAGVYVGDVVVNGGTSNISGIMSTHNPEKPDWRAGSMLGGDNNVTINKATINVGNNGQIVGGHDNDSNTENLVSINDSIIKLNGSKNAEALLRAAGNNKDSSLLKVNAFSVINVEDGHVGTISSDRNQIDGKINIDGTLNVRDGANLGKGTLNFANASTYQFSINNTATQGGLINGNVALVGDVNLKTDISYVKLDATQYQFINGNVDTTAGKWVEDLGTNTLYDVALNTDNNALDFNKKSTREIASNTGANGNQAGAVSAVLDGIGNNKSFNNIANNINSLLQSSNPSDVEQGLKMVDKMSSDTNSSAQSTTSQNTTQVFGAVGAHLSGGSASGAVQGKSSGDSSFDNGAVWVQGLVSKAELDGANGFDADTNGITFGAEKQITDATKVGIGYAYSKTDIDSASRTTDVDNHTAIAYGEYKPSNWFVNGIATYGWGSYDESNAIKKASYDVNSFGLQAMTGYNIETNSMMLTPETGLRYVNIKQKSYRDSLGSKIGANNSDILTGVAGLKVSKEFAMSNGMTLKPEARAALTYDISNDDANSVVTLANGSNYITRGEALDKFGQEIGLGLTAGINENVDISLGYEGKFRQDYTDHSGLFNAKYKF